MCSFILGFQPFSLTAFSSCGNYLAAVAHSVICIWDMNNFKTLTNFTHERGHKICGLQWNPSVTGEVAYCDVMGQLGTIESLLPKAGTDGAKTAVAVPEVGGLSVSKMYPLSLSMN